MELLKKITIILLFVAIAMISIAKITPMATDVDSHAHSVAQIDKEIECVLKLTAGATGASAAISLLPDDQCTPISEQFAELAKYFLVVLSALYLEKYLVTLTGYVSFSFFIPLACILLVCGILGLREKVRAFAYKLMIVAVALYFIIPLSVKTSEMIYDNYESSINRTIDIASQISVENEESGVVDKFMSWIQNAAMTIVEYVTELLSKFIEAVAVMLVTSCLIPILVIVFFFWMFKLLFKLDFSLSEAERFIHSRLTGGHYEREN